ncbi:MAG: transglycosylase SLT domain-containing protein [Bacteroidota bacterium]
MKRPGFLGTVLQSLLVGGLIMYVFASTYYANIFVVEDKAFLSSAPTMQEVQPWLETPSLIKVSIPKDTHIYEVIRENQLYEQGWDTLNQPTFWRRAMYVSPDTSLINIAKSREIIGEIPTREWWNMRKKSKKAYKDSIRQFFSLEKEDEIYVTSGQNHFYRFREVIPDISSALPVFREEEVDPWYAQAILLIESPGRSRTSIAGAQGAFQLMKGVARELGLTVNKHTDERTDFQKSAKAAARFLKRTCIPHTREILEKENITFNENEIWFKLLVLHVYHAGWRNVRGAIRKMKAPQAGKQLILDLWQTEYRNFSNSSQNYSQLILASMLELDEVLFTQCKILPN